MKTIGWVFLIAYIAYWINKKTYWFTNKEKMAEKCAKKLAKVAEEDNKHRDSWGSILSRENAERSEKRLQNFTEAYENYLHLIEKFKHDKRIKQVKKDWVNYLIATKTKLDCGMDYGMNLDEKQLRNTGRKDRLAAIATEEIEKRFKKLAKE